MMFKLLIIFTILISKYSAKMIYCEIPCPSHAVCIAENKCRCIEGFEQAISNETGRPHCLYVQTTTTVTVHAGTEKSTLSTNSLHTSVRDDSEQSENSEYVNEVLTYNHQITNKEMTTTSDVASTYLMETTLQPQITTPNNFSPSSFDIKTSKACSGIKISKDDLYIALGLLCVITAKEGRKHDKMNK
uniref:EB domain-containing protein n=1 Tax=Glossina austeni TaxID=7395 RepID=A0A1A9VXD0_GLOAU